MRTRVLGGFERTPEKNRGDVDSLVGRKLRQLLYTPIFMFYNVLWEFSTNPLSLVYNSAEQKNPVLIFLRFRDLTELKQT